jgi:hypothetical protein
MSESSGIDLIFGVRSMPKACSLDLRERVLAATAATHSSASPRLAPSSESRSGITSAQDWLSQAARPSHTCRNWSPPNPDRPDRREFCPSYNSADSLTKIASRLGDCDAVPSRSAVQT